MALAFESRHVSGRRSRHHTDSALGNRLGVRPVAGIVLLPMWFWRRISRRLAYACRLALCRLGWLLVAGMLFAPAGMAMDGIGFFGISLFSVCRIMDLQLSAFAGIHATLVPGRLLFLVVRR